MKRASPSLQLAYTWAVSAYAVTASAQKMARVTEAARRSRSPAASVRHANVGSGEGNARAPRGGVHPRKVNPRKEEPHSEKAKKSTRLPNVLGVDIGGTKVKILATGQSEPRKAPSGLALTPTRLVEMVEKLADGWQYDVITIGYPGLVGENGPSSEPGNVGPGWVGFDFAAAFSRPVRIVNDAAMQALGSYDGGRMLFLGLGTGLGSALIVENTLVTLELGRLLDAGGKRTLGETLGRRGFEALGKKEWRRQVGRIAPALMAAFVADYLVVGGGNAKQLKGDALPPGVRLGHNLTAFRGAFRLWRLDDLPSREDHRHAHAAPVGSVRWTLL